MRSERSVLLESANGSFSSSKAAMSQAREVECGVLNVECLVARIILAMRGWQGRADMRFPIGVMLPFSSIAPSCISRFLALNTLARGGNVSQGKVSTLFSPKAAISRIIGARSASSISAVRCSAIRCSEALVHNR